MTIVIAYMWCGWSLSLDNSNDSRDTIDSCNKQVGRKAMQPSPRRLKKKKKTGGKKEAASSGIQVATPKLNLDV